MAPTQQSPGARHPRSIQDDRSESTEQRFELLELLGRGGMGSVYRARDLEAGRDVALKLLTQANSQASRERFLRREGELTAALDHPGIVKIHSAGIARGVPYLAYELIDEGRPLRAERGEAGRRRFVERLRDLAQAVGHAHRLGIVHRDLKPDNLLVDAAGRVRVADFGLAWTAGVEALTQTGAMVGTPHFMAPEAFVSAQHEPTVDVWSLGAILYEGLTGVVPADGNSLIEVAAAANRPIPRPRAIDPTISLALESVCTRALAHEPSERYPDAAELAAALGDALEGRWTAGPSRRSFVSVLRAALAFGVILAFALLGVSAISVAPVVPPPSAGDVRQRVATKPPALSTKDIARGDYELSKLAREAEPEELLRNLEPWLVDFAGHPRVPEARRMSRDARRQIPLLLAKHPGKAAPDVYHPLCLVEWTSQQRFAVAPHGANPRLSLWDLREGSQPAATFNAPLNRASFSPGRGVLATTWEKGLRVYLDPSNPAETRDYDLASEVGTSQLLVVSFHPNGERVFVGSSGGHLVELELSTGRVVRAAQTLRAVQGARLSPSGEWLVLGLGARCNGLGIGSEGEIQLWDYRTWTLVDQMVVDGRPRIVFSDEERTFVAGGSSGTIRKFRYGPEGLALLANFERPGAASGTEQFVGQMAAHLGFVHDLAYLAGRFYSIAGRKSGGGEIRVWDAESSELLWEVPLDARPYAMAVNKSGIAVFAGQDSIFVYPSD